MPTFKLCFYVHLDTINPNAYLASGNWETNSSSPLTTVSGAIANG
ncbi:MAG: hypothetical protein VX786_04585 [Pseudomonadota bacterium]|nr:hypothetical protein [Pseudomonadota bacterium]